MNGTGRRIIGALARGLRSAVTPRATARRAGAGSGPDRRSAGAASGVGGYPGDYRGRIRPRYSPQLDGEPDPGEIVWTWVPFEEDHSQGKDRPVLLIGHDGPWLLGLQLTSKDHDRDADQEASWGRYWMDIGAGAWDHRRRPSEVRLDRIIRIDPAEVRREGAVLERRRFNQVARSLRKHHQW